MAVTERLALFSSVVIICSHPSPDVSVLFLLLVLRFCFAF